MMKNKTIILLIVSICVIFILTGCSKYEKDSSYDTDLYCTYKYSVDGVAGTGT